MEDSSLWHVDDGAPHRLFSTSVPSEGVLEDWVQKEPSLIAHGLQVVGRHELRVSDTIVRDTAATLNRGKEWRKEADSDQAPQP